MTTQVLADTYAWVALFKGSEPYTVLESSQWLLTEYSVAECYYALLKVGGEQLADEKLPQLWERTIPITPAVVKRAMLLKLNRHKDRLSYADCLGYALAQELGIPFLTGDQKFKDTDGVLFVTEA